MVDGCDLHGCTTTSVEARWESVERIIAATPEDDHDAQWSVINYCACCLGPGKLPAELCSRCQVTP